MKICIDIGGTQTRVAQINKELELIDLQVFKTTIPSLTMKLISDYLKDKNISQINISTCGPIDINTGIYGNLPNLKSWIGFNIKDYINKLLNCKIYIDNDANCATLFEAYMRPNLENLVYITLSTGVGAGAIVNNHLLKGATNDAVSPYKYYVNPTTTIEQLCSGTGLVVAASKENASIKVTKDIFTLENKYSMKTIIDEWTTNLAIFFVNINALLETQCFILGGSVIVNNPGYIEQIAEKMKSMNCFVNLELTTEMEYNALKGAYLIDEQ